MEEEEENRSSSSQFRHVLQTEAYAVQNQRWPKFGQFILAQYTGTPTPTPCTAHLHRLQ
jgi:hypothetical protein